MHTKQTVIAPYAAGEMFALVDDINAYPTFLPWCSNAAARRLPRDTGAENVEIVEADVDISYRGFSARFSTRNTHTRDESIEMALMNDGAGPLAALEGGWRFIPLDRLRCRVEFELRYGFRNRLMGAVMNKVFAAAFEKFVDSFISRAQTRYPRLQIEVADVAAARARQITLPAGATVSDAIIVAEMSDIATDKTLSVYGKPSDANAVLSDGDRVEINQPLAQNPREMRRNRQ